MRTTGRTSTLVAALALTAVLIPQSAHADLIVFQDRVVFGLTIDSDPSLIKTVESWDTYPAGTIFLNGSTVNGITYDVSAGEALVVSTGISLSLPNNQFQPVACGQDGSRGSHRVGGPAAEGPVCLGRHAARCGDGHSHTAILGCVSTAATL